MIQVYICGDDKPHEFKTPYNALRFMYMMDHKGYIVSTWTCDDPSDNEWISRRYRQ